MRLSKMRWMLVTTAAVALVGCGGGSSESPEDEIRSTVEGFAHDLAAGENGRACERSTDREKCLQALITASALLGEQSTRDLFKDAKVTSVRLAPGDKSATVRYTGDDSPTKVVNRGGRWLVVAE